MWKLRHNFFALANCTVLPELIIQLFPDNMPTYLSNYEENASWLSTYNKPHFRSSVFYKGPILAITDQNMQITCPTSIFSINIYKKAAKRVLLEIQSSGSEDNWPNFLLYSLPGLRTSTRINTKQQQHQLSKSARIVIKPQLY